MKTERTCLTIVNILLFAVALFLFTGCSTFEKAFRRYGSTANDTTYTTIVNTIKRDSVQLVVKTDTTHLIERTKQGRATVTIYRDRLKTIVTANCDSAKQSTVVPTRIITQKWGVDPSYAQSSKRWKLAFIALAVVFILGAILLWFISRFTVSVNRKNG